MTPSIFTNPCIIHFPCCGFQNFYAKYKTLKNFSHKWFGLEDISKNIPIHLRSRDIFKKGDLNLMREFYEMNFITKPNHYAEIFLNENIYFRINLINQKSL